jgi:hypothetical protein
VRALRVNASQGEKNGGVPGRLAGFGCALQAGAGVGNEVIVLIHVVANPHGTPVKGRPPRTTGAIPRLPRTPAHS